MFLLSSFLVDTSTESEKKFYKKIFFLFKNYISSLLLDTCTFCTIQWYTNPFNTQIALDKFNNTFFCMYSSVPPALSEKFIKMIFCAIVNHMYVWWKWLMCYVIRMNTMYIIYRYIQHVHTFLHYTCTIHTETLNAEKYKKVRIYLFPPVYMTIWCTLQK